VAFTGQADALRSRRDPFRRRGNCLEKGIDLLVD
jgi:hypothetical protein